MSVLARQRQLVNIWIVRSSIVVCVALIVSGFALFFVHGAQRIPPTPSGHLLDIVAGAWRAACRLDPAGFLDGALIVLLLTPVLRLANGIVMSVRAGDGLYAAIGLLVLMLVLVGMTVGGA